MERDKQPKVKSEMVGLAQAVHTLKTEVGTLQQEFRTASESATNREAVLRECMGQRFQASEEQFK